MLDFMTVATRPTKRGVIEIYPRFKIRKTEDLMIRGGDFYAIWVEDRGIWSTDEQDAIFLIDRELDRYAAENKDKFDANVKVMHLEDAESGMIDVFHKYCQKQMRDSFEMLDEQLIFSNTETNKKAYASKRLDYPLEQGDISAYDRLMSTLYDEEERRKIEWAIGSIVTGDSKKIQKFMVLYGAAGTGKSTVLNIIEKLFKGYYSVFDAKALGSTSNVFALEAFKTNPLVAIQHDGDLSKIEDNTRLNSLVSHELMTINEKFKSTYANRFKCFLFMGTNKPVKITDAKSGLMRRLIDVHPSGNKLNVKEYNRIVKKIDFEIGAIAWHCKEVYLSDPARYDNYIPIEMLGATNDFYNFVTDMYFSFKEEDAVTLKSAWEMYKTYCDDAKVPYPYAQRTFKEELKNYFRDYKERGVLEDGTRVRSYYIGFKTDKFDSEYEEEFVEPSKPNVWLKFDKTVSIFDTERADCPAQYATPDETPSKQWDDVKTKLSDLKTSKLHYVRVPENHIVIDFDIKDETGSKSLELNLAEALKWPNTYAELSKSGKGIHLHYIYSGDPTKLSRIYDDNIEIKVFTGKSSLRRMLTKCNDIPIATINSGLPLKGEKKMINKEAVQTEKGLRTIIKRNLNKEYHPGTKPSIDFIHKVLEDAYNSDLHYDVSDLYTAVLAFAANSTNQADYCVKLVAKMKFKSEEPSENVEAADDSKLIFYDIEVFPNLFIVCYKMEGEGKPVVKLINPKPVEIEELIKFKLVGFNNRRYDNHILYARLMGYSNEQLYKLSQRIISNDKNAMFGEAYNLSYTDIYDFSSKKQSLKKWEIELGIHHQELGLPWDEPVPEDMWFKVAEYCVNDVVATEAVFNHLSGDWLGRQILADIAEMTVNDTTNSLTTRIILGKNRKPNLVYTDLATGKQTYNGAKKWEDKDVINSFPGYEFTYIEGDNKKHNMYRGTDLGKGGYVYAEPGMYTNVAILDVASMHPHSAVAMSYFGEYTKNFEELLNTRILIKHKEYDKAKELFGGRLVKYLSDPDQAKALSQALKIAINAVYGLTSAGFENPMRDNRNDNNIVALRGALFMRTLQDEVAMRGFTVAHIKTDSIKIPNATPEIIEFCMNFAKLYGYTFEHENTYDRMCLVNNAVYIARYSDEPINGKDAGTWTATGTQFQIPYVFKTLFSKEPYEFEDFCETKEVKTALYIDMNEGLPEDEHNYHFVGRVGSFCPIKPGFGGGLLVRESINKKTGEKKYDNATGAKGYRWLEAEMVKVLEKEDDIDLTYYNALVDGAVESISEYGDFEWFVSQ